MSTTENNLTDSPADRTTLAEATAATTASAALTETVTQTELEAMQTRYENLISGLQSEIQRLSTVESQKLEAQNRLADATQAIRTETTAANEARARLADSEANQARLMDQLRAAETERAGAQDELRLFRQGVDSRIQSLTTERDGAVAQARDLRVQFANFRAQLRVLASSEGTQATPVVNAAPTPATAPLTAFNQDGSTTPTYQPSEPTATSETTPSAAVPTTTR